MRNTDTELLFQIELSQEANSHPMQELRSFKLGQKGKLGFRRLLILSA